MTNRLIISVVLFSAASMFLLSGCCLKHEWTPATCEAPETCAKCGTMRGEKGEHDWVEASCKAPKTCSVCRETEGEKTEHSWVEASFTEPKTCSECGATEGNPLHLKEVDISFLGDANVYVVGSEHSVSAKYSKDGRSMLFRIYDDAHNVTNEQTIATDFDSWGFGVGYEKYSMVFMTKSAVTAYDYDGNVINMIKGDFSKYYKENQMYLTPVLTDNPDVFKANDANNEFAYAINLVTGEVSEDNSGVDAVPGEWYYICKQSVGDFYLAGTVDTQNWGYVDSEGKWLAKYSDASDFLNSGYALCSNDRKTYDLIDSNLDVVLENACEGVSASRSGDVFAVRDANDGVHYYVISAE